MRDDVGAALYHITDLRESMDRLKIMSTSKQQLDREVVVWLNNVAVVESLLNDMLKKCE